MTDIDFEAQVYSVHDIMNCEVCHLKELEVEEHSEIREVLRCILHTIVFHRALGLVRPKDKDSELFEITYVQCEDSELEKKIEEKIDLFIFWVEKHPNKKSQVCLSFYEVKNNKATWFTNKTERLYWEQWYINLNITKHPKAHRRKSHHSEVIIGPGDCVMEEKSGRQAALETSLHEVLFQIIKFVNEKRDHIPPVPNVEGVSFPYEITIPSSSDSTFGMDMFKRMLQTGHPTMLS
ncbi:PREDICTED: autophagy-related protein 101-like [Nelumbo nucifera]|uniref:Autophagy-related protein 101 n=1 Tax=Nelumbo nucifera TaxID=4432 RepID=A0A1U8AM25_NELNU|nr:PREDICTED: autophagy-related protein 101-like [Nelumbo nucifera]